MTTTEIQKLAELIHWNPKAWQSVRQCLGTTSTIDQIQELTDDKLLIYCTDPKQDKHRLLLDLNTCAIDKA